MTKSYLILVVEDEALIRMDIVSELEASGMKVVEAINALDAIGKLEATPDIDAVFTDIDMPGEFDGIQLARIVALRYPTVHVIVTSGHSQEFTADLPEVAQFFRKPYASAAVARAIRFTIDGDGDEKRRAD